MNQFANREIYPGRSAARTVLRRDLPAMDRAIADAGPSEEAAEQIRELGLQEFRAGNPRPWGPASRRTLEAKLGVTRWRLAARERQLLRTPETRLVMCAGRVQASRIYPVMGWTMMVVAVVMLTPIPLVVAIGIAEGAMTLYALMERPWLAVLYGFAPWGALAALKLLRHGLAFETQRSWFDIGLAAATLVAFAMWIDTYADTFLADTSAGALAALEAAGSLGTFYTTQLLLEVAAGYSAWTLAERLLSHGMTHEAVPDAGYQALVAGQERDFAVEEELAARLDAVDAALARHEAAETAFVATNLGRLAGYQHRLKALSDNAFAEALSALRADFTNDSEVHATEEPRDA